MHPVPTLVIGADASWRIRVQQQCAGHRSVEWLGAYAPGEPRQPARVTAALLLVDGDDPRARLRRRRPLLPPPRHVEFFLRPDLRCLLRCVSAQSNGCLSKGASTATLLKAVRCAGAGLFVAEAFAIAPLRRVLADACAEDVPHPAQPLTPRQLEVVRWASLGMSNKEIARQLGISPETVKSHLHQAFASWHVRGRVGLLSALATAMPEGDAYTGAANTARAHVAHH